MSDSATGLFDVLLTCGPQIGSKPLHFVFAFWRAALSHSSRPRASLRNQITQDKDQQEKKRTNKFMMARLFPPVVFSRWLEKQRENVLYFRWEGPLSKFLETMWLIDILGFLFAGNSKKSRSTPTKPRANDLLVARTRLVSGAFGFVPIFPESSSELWKFNHHYRFNT